MGKIFCVEFKRYPLKFHTKYLTHTLKDVYFIHRRKFKTSYIQELVSLCETAPWTNVYQDAMQSLRFHDGSHDDVIKWKHFSRYWPFVRITHLSPVTSPHTGQWRGALMFSLTCALNKRLSKQSWGWWFEVPSRSLWRHCNGTNVCCLLRTPFTNQDMLNQHRL